MADRYRHPQALGIFRVVLYSVATLAAFGILVTTIGFLGITVVVAAFAHLLTGSGGTIAVIGFGVALLASGIGVGGAVAIARRVDRYVRRADRMPDRVEALKNQYVDGELTVVELERELENVLYRDPTAGKRATTSGTDGRKARE